MNGNAAATVIVTSRDRFGHAVETLELLLARTDPRHRVIVVDGAAPPDVAAAFDRIAATGRIEVIRRDRYLATNEGRRLAVDAGLDTDWVAFVENDAVPDDGWLETLIGRAEATGSASTFPVYLENRSAGLVVHGCGADLEFTQAPAGRHIREINHHVDEPWESVSRVLTETPRHQAEPHCVVLRRDVLEATGGPDPDLLGWFEHTDLALHHLDRGVECRLVPDVGCLYRPAARLGRREIPSFLLRWGTGWFEHSLRRLCDRWDLDPADPIWAAHERYRVLMRRSVMVPGKHRTNRLIDAAITPADRLVRRRWFSARRRDALPARRGPDASRR